MKKLFFYAAMLVVVCAFVGCKSNETVDTDSTKLWPAMSGEKWGFINAKGQFAISPIYNGASGFSCGYSRAWLSDNKPIFIDKKGNMQQGTYDNAGDFCYKYARIVLNDNYGFMSTKFDITCQPIYNGLGTLTENGLAAAKMGTNDKWGYVNAKGEQKITAMYDSADDFESGVAVVRMSDKYGVINTKGSYAISPFYDDLFSIGGGLIAYEQNGKVGALDTDGKTVIQPIFDEIGYCFDNDLIPAAQNDKCGYINKKGVTKLMFMYDAATSFSEGYAVVTMNGRQQFIDTKGNVKIMLSDNEWVETLFHNGLALIASYSTSSSTTSYRYVDTKGAIVYSWSVKGAPLAPAKKSMVQESKELVKKTTNFDSRNLEIR